MLRQQDSSPSSPEWLTVDRHGLAKLVDHRGREFAVYELIQNAWDQRVTEVQVTLQPIAGRRGVAHLIVEDDDPEGFADLTDVYRLFGPSAKLANPTQRGRFNLGEKVVLSLCEEAEVASTTGVVRFGTAGRTRTNQGKRARGTCFTAVIRMTKADIERVAAKVRMLIPPAGIATFFNGELLQARSPVETFAVSLETVVSEDGVSRLRTRRTRVELYEPLTGEPARLFEMGIPVVKTGDRWDYNISQKVPVNTDRDNVKPSYLRRLRLAVLNAMHDKLTGEDTTSGWVRQAAEDGDCSNAAIKAVVDQRFGTKVVSHDPNDPDSTVLAVEAGYAVVHGRQLSKGEWANAKRVGVIPPAPQLFPSHSRLNTGPDGDPLIRIPQENWSAGMREVAAYFTEIGSKLVERPVTVQIVSMPRVPAQAWYGDGQLTMNLPRLGRGWFELGISEEVDALLIHELGHEYSDHHRGTDYYDALCRLGARLKRLSGGAGSRLFRGVLFRPTGALFVERIIQAVVFPADELGTSSASDSAGGINRNHWPTAAPR